MNTEQIKLRPGFGVSLPPKCLKHLDPWLEAQRATDAALVGMSNTEAARQDPDALREAVCGMGWASLSDAERAELRRN